MSVRSRPYRSDDDLRRMQDLLVQLWRLEGPRVETHVGDLAWRRFMHVGREDEWRIRLWEENGSPIAYGWVQLPASLQYEIHPRHRCGPLHEELLAWFDQEAEGEELRASGLSSDSERLAVLCAHGFEVDPEARQLVYHVRDLLDVPEPVVPDRVRLRTVGKEDLDGRVAAHRASFAPSRVTAESYRKVMAAWPYRPELDCVAEAPDGSFAAFCLAWLDPENRVGELEPVGTHPDYRRLGLGAAVCRYALRRLREEGAQRAVVYAWSASPGKALYESIGFREHTRSLELVKRR